MNDLFSQFANQFKPKEEPKPEIKEEPVQLPADKQLDRWEAYMKLNGHIPLRDFKLLEKREQAVDNLETMSEFEKKQRRLADKQKIFLPSDLETKQQVFDSLPKKVFQSWDGEKVIESAEVQPPVTVTPENYNFMPLGQREAQERNGVRDHGLGLFATGLDPYYTTPPDSSAVVIKKDDKIVAVYEGRSNKSVELEVEPLEDNVTFLDENVTKAKPKFGRAKFKKDPANTDKRKIKATKKEQDGFVFDSTLELYMYNLLKENNIRFDMKTTYTLQEGFTYRHEAIRPMTVTPDFILLDYPVIIDTKGFSNERAPMQYKMLKHYFHTEGKEIDILMPSNQLKCRNIIDGLLNGFKVEEPLTEHAATVRKNKLKKLKFEWVNGCWDKPGISLPAEWVMTLRKYEFEELLIKYS